MSETDTPALQATNLSHAYASYQVLAPTDLTLHAGEVVSLHGANGAGKSTLLLCLSGLLRPTTGEVLACGHDLYEDEPAAKRCLAFVPDVPRFYLELTTWEHLRFIALAHGAHADFDARAEQWLHDFGLWDVRDMFPHHFSRGMRLKLGLLLAFIRPFKVLLLDEPTSALDDASSQLVAHHLGDLRQQGAAILIATHDPELQKRVADRSLTLADGLLDRQQMTNPIWTLYTRRFGQRLGYWLSALGLNWRDTSTSNRLYMLYFFGFWAIWAVAVFALLGGYLAALLGVFKDVSPAQIALGLGEISLVGWTLYSLWRASRRSPFVFTEEDAHLVCQTPVSRPGVALALFLLNWYEIAFLFAFGTIAVSFGVVQALHTGPFLPEQLADYLAYSLKALSLMLPLHLGLQALTWTLGALRLRGRQDYPLLRWAAPALGALLIVTPLSLPSQAAVVLRVLQQPWLWPINKALATAFVPGGRWWLGALAALVFAALSLAALVAASQRLSFSRAAQETTMQAMLQGARRFGQTDLVQQIQLKQRLGSGRKPSELFSRPGSWVMLSKAIIQFTRGFSLNQVVTWIYIAGLSVGALTAPNIFVQLLLGGLWVLAVGNAATTRLRSDMANWGIMRLLPLPAQQLFLAEVAVPWTVIVLLGEAAIVLTPALAPGYRLVMAAMLPFLAGSVALAAGADVLRQAHVRTLMVPALATENVPQPGLWGLLQGLVSVAICMGVLNWTLTQSGATFWAPLAVGLAFLIAELNLGSVLQAYRWIH